MTFQSVLSPGKVYATILSEPTNQLPGNFAFVEPALVFRKLPLVQGPGNSVCVDVTGFSEFALGFAAPAVPASSTVGLGWLLSLVGLTGIALLRRRSAGAQP